MSWKIKQIILPGYLFIKTQRCLTGWACGTYLVQERRWNVFLGKPMRKKQIEDAGIYSRKILTL